MCEYVAGLENTFTSRDTVGLMETLPLDECALPAANSPAVTPGHGNTVTEDCLQTGSWRGEGYSVRLAELEEFWEREFDAFEGIRGVVYPELSSVRSEGSARRNSPAIILGTDDQDADRIVFVTRSDGEWSIAAYLRITESAASFEAPSGVLIPWEWPNESGSIPWFGMQAALDDWELSTEVQHPASYGSLRHRSIPGCRVDPVAFDPYLAAGQPQSWTRSTMQFAALETVVVELVNYRDSGGRLKLSYLELFDASVSRVPSLYRLGYFLIEPTLQAAECAEAFQRLLTELDPAAFPDLPVPQG